MRPGDCFGSERRLASFKKCPTVADVNLSRAVRWEPRREFLLRLDDREDVKDPVMYAHREFQKKDSRAAKIRDRLYSEACEDLLRRMRSLSGLIGTASGEGRGPRAKMNDLVTDEMRDAQEELPEANQAVEQARERCEDLEDEYTRIRQWQSRNFDPVPIRRTSLPKLKDRREVMKRFGTPPSPSELDRQARRMGTAYPAETEDEDQAESQAG